LTSSKKFRYRLFFLPQALEEWKSLDGSVKDHLKKLLAKRLDHPHVPGGELHGELSGHYKIKLKKQGVRLVYAVEDAMLIVMVMAVDKREDNLVYKSAVSRLAAKAADLSRIVASGSGKRGAEG
jgi:mRNA interferase RelE/StbE